MTREEARKILENLKEHTLNYQSGLALDMGISALSAIEDIKADIDKLNVMETLENSKVIHIIDKHIVEDK